MRDKSLAMLINSRLARSCLTRAAVTAVERDLPGVPESVGEARRMVRQLLADSPAAEVAALLVSELVTNALTYSRSGGPGGTVRVTARTGFHQVRICVRDQGSRFGTPALATSPPGTEHGYGLRIVAALAAEWGTAPVLHGTRTWCLIRWEGDQ
jgi:anti-sigma regulatory factor (Ser/Thr protein kinase)